MTAYVPLEQVDLRLLYPEVAHRLPVMLQCPFHTSDSSPSLGVYPHNTYCFSCQTVESVFEHIERYLLDSRYAQGSDTPVEQADILALAAQLRGSGPARASGVEQTALDAGIVADYEHILAEYFHRREWLTRKYGLTEATQRAAHIGYAGHAYSLPVYRLDGLLLNVRFRSDPNMSDAGSAKYWGVSGHNTVAWYLPPSWRGESLAAVCRRDYKNDNIILTEGEFDALAGWQLGLPTISLTNGKDAHKRAPAHFEALRGLTVWVAYDQDERGRAAAAEVLQVLQQMDIACKPVTWAPARGKDLSELVAGGLNRSGFRSLLLAPVH